MRTYRTSSPCCPWTRISAPRALGRSSFETRMAAKGCGTLTVGIAFFPLPAKRLRSNPQHNHQIIHNFIKRHANKHGQNSLPKGHCSTPLFHFRLPAVN
ncbi:MAG: hypothetical protein AAGJ35_10515, partial [Myxococcota bacterium]